MRRVISCYFFLIIVIGVYLLQSSEQITGFIDPTKNKGLVQKVSRRFDRNKFSIRSGRFNCRL